MRDPYYDDDQFGGVEQASANFAGVGVVGWVAAVLVLAGLFLIWWAWGAAAQTTQPVSTVVNVGQTWEALAPAIALLANAVLVPLILAGIGWLYSKVAHKKMEDSHRDVFQTALANAAGYVVMQAGGKLTGVTLDVRSPVIASAIKMVQDAAPDALEHFGLTAEKVLSDKRGKAGTGALVTAGKATVERILADKIVAKIPQLPGLAGQAGALAGMAGPILDAVTDATGRPRRNL